MHIIIIRIMSSTHFECLLQCGKPCELTDSIENMTHSAWEKLKLKSLNWKGCDRIEMHMIVWIGSLNHTANICMQVVDFTYQAQTS